MPIVTLKEVASIKRVEDCVNPFHIAAPHFHYKADIEGLISGVESEIDPSYDDDFPYPHLDPPELNDI